MEKSWQLKNFEALDQVFEGSLYKSEGLAGALGLVAQASEDAAMAQKTGSTIWNKATRWISGYSRPLGPRVLITDRVSVFTALETARYSVIA